MLTLAAQPAAHLGGGGKGIQSPTNTNAACGAGQGEGMHSYIPWSAMDLFVHRPTTRPRTAFAYPIRVEIHPSIGSQVGPRHSPFKRGIRGFESHPIDQLPIGRLVKSSCLRFGRAW
jgi:hypothetical protein